MGMPFVKLDMGRARRPEAAAGSGGGFGEEPTSRPHEVSAIARNRVSSKKNLPYSPCLSLVHPRYDSLGWHSVHFVGTGLAGSFFFRSA
jgi:hypothetical protein